MKPSGLLISCAMPAASWPIDASFSRRMIRACDSLSFWLASASCRFIFIRACSSWIRSVMSFTIACILDIFLASPRMRVALSSPKTLNRPARARITSKFLTEPVSSMSFISTSWSRGFAHSSSSTRPDDPALSAS